MRYDSMSTLRCMGRKKESPHCQNDFQARIVKAASEQQYALGNLTKSEPYLRPELIITMLSHANSLVFSVNCRAADYNGRPTIQCSS